MQELKVQYNQKELSQEEEQFNLLLERIETLTAAIEERKLLNAQFTEARNKELQPIIHKIKSLKLRQVNVLDHLFNTRNFSKNEFKRIRQEIIQVIELILDQFPLGSEDEDHLFTLLSFHKGVSKDVTQQKYQQIHLDDVQPETDETEEPKSFEEQKIASLGRKSLEKMTQSIRSIYISLVKKLHPDKEPDENEKIRKTEVVKQLTEAYENKDLLSLLLLQSKYQISKEKDLKDLRSYNQILEEQVSTLEEEYSALYAVLGNESFMSEKSLKKLIKSRKKELNRYFTQEEQLLEVVYSVPEHLVAYLK